MVVAGVAAFALLRGKANSENKTSLRMAILMMAIVAPLQVLVGHESGVVAHEHQPAKVAAMEGWWETRAQQPTILLALPDEANERNIAEIGVPGLGSWVVAGDADAELEGLDAFAPEDRPPVAIVFWAFRIMVAMGLAMVGLGLLGAALWALKRLDTAKLYHRLLVLAAPSGFIAVLSGWIAAEVGRQPYVIYNVMRTEHAVSPVAGEQVALSLMVFMIVYAIVFSAGALYILRLMAKGPDTDETAPAPQDRPPGDPLQVAEGV
jgi:cytochrome d ubiquinol oxidase subunit I